MFTQLVNFLGRSLQTKSATPIRRTALPQNPFETYSGNPFVNSYEANRNPYYGKNRPVAGGYFAGYYNGKPNIVGTRLFIEA